MKKRFGKREAAVSLCVVFSLILMVTIFSGGLQRPAATVGGGDVVMPQRQDGPAKTPSDTPPSDTAVAQEAAATAATPSMEEDAPSGDSEDADNVVLIDSGEQQEAPATKEPFAMPEGMECEPETALITVSPSASASEVNEALQAIEGISFEPVTDEQIELGLIRVKLSEGISVEEGVNQLLAADVVSAAQPNYIYRASDLLSSNAAKDDESAQDATGGAGSASSDGAGSANSAAGTVGEDAAEAPTSNTSSTNSNVTKDTSDEPVGTVGNATAGTSEPKTTPSDEAEDAKEGVVSAESGTEVLSPAGEAAAGVRETAKVEAEASKEQVNDEFAKDQWGLDSIHAREAWTLQKVSGAVTVAVVDMGFNKDAEDLKDNMLPGYNAFANNYDVYTGSSDHRQHGTHVAGIIGAVTNNELGVAGVTYNAKVLPIMAAGIVKGEWAATSESFYRSFRYVLNNAAKMNIRVINMSIGSPAMNVESWARRYVEQAYKQNIVTVTSAGNLVYPNYTAYEHYPSDIEECVAVMSLRKSGSGVARASDSNYNRNAYDFKDICAPGVDILSATGTDKKYEILSGTSMATPFVSSVLALEFAANPKLTAKDAVSILYGTTTDLGAAGWDVNYGWGEVNAYGAVNAAKTGLPASKLTEQANLNAKQERLRVDAAARSITYRTHVQSHGWMGWKSNGAMSGTSGEAKRMEAINIKLVNAPYAGGVIYRTHVQSYGWMGWKTNGVMSGTSGQAKRMEAIELKLTGKMSEKYDIWYRVHAQSYGWLGWAKNGASAGTAGMAKRLEAIQIRVLPKGSAAPGSTAQPFVLAQVTYRTHVQTFGWQGYTFNGLTSGTTGSAKRLEGINISLVSPAYSGGITYRTHVQTYGWQGWKSNGAMSGTSGQAKRLEAIQIQLTGTMASKYDIWYRVHAQTFGWMGWAKNGEQSGTAGMAKRLEAIQIVMLPKGSAAPGTTSGAFRSK